MRVQSDPQNSMGWFVKYGEFPQYVHNEGRITAEKIYSSIARTFAGTIMTKFWPSMCGIKEESSWMNCHWLFLRGLADCTSGIVIFYQQEWFSCLQGDIMFDVFHTHGYHSHFFCNAYSNISHCPLITRNFNECSDCCHISSQCNHQYNLIWMCIHNSMILMSIIDNIQYRVWRECSISGMICDSLISDMYDQRHKSNDRLCTYHGLSNYLKWFQYFDWACYSFSYSFHCAHGKNIRFSMK